MIYCVDFDGTLFVNNEANIGLIMTCKALQAHGHAVVLFTSRTGERLREAVRLCRQHGLVFQNVIGGKPIADFYIDDKAINPRGGIYNG